jgi:hypothetical protein
VDNDIVKAAKNAPDYKGGDLASDQRDRFNKGHGCSLLFCRAPALGSCHPDAG